MTLSEYIEQHSSPESEVLKKITRSTHLEVINPRMLSGHVQGRVLSMISQMIQPTRILELGTFTGYSALCLAEGLFLCAYANEIFQKPQRNRHSLLWWHSVWIIIENEIECLLLKFIKR